MSAGKLCKVCKIVVEQERPSKTPCGNPPFHFPANCDECKRPEMKAPRCANQGCQMCRPVQRPMGW